MLFINYIYYCFLLAISLLFIWFALTILQLIFNKYSTKRKYRFAQTYYHDNEYNRI